MNKREKIWLAMATFFFAFWLNRAFLDWVSLPTMLEMNDVSAIIAGYRETPNLFSDGLRWWSGSWIHQDVNAFRPLSSYLYWIDCWLGLHWGFIWTAWIGVLLLTINSLLSGALAWRLTKLKLCVVLAVALGISLRFYNWGSATPDYWLAWFAVQDNLLCCAFLLAGILCFDCWIESSYRGYLTCTWFFWLAAALTKEYAYVFPLFAFAIAFFRRKNSPVEFKFALTQCVLMMAFVLALWFYRAGILIDARNPTLKRIHFIRKPWLYVFYPFYKHILTEQYWFPGLALVIFSIAGVLLRWKNGAKSYLLQKPFVPILVGFCVVAIIALYCAITFSVTNAFWYLFDLENGSMHLVELLTMIATFYTVYLLWKYRKTEPTALAFAFLVLSYAPVITYLGWHYTVPAAFIRSAYWGLVAKLVWLDVSPILLLRVLPLWRKAQLSLTAARSKSSPA